MSKANLLHPPADRLEAYRAGRLEPAEAATVAEHLATCAACRTAMTSSDADTIPPAALPPYRNQARPPASPPSPALRDQATLDAPVSPPPSDLPAALASHPRYRVLRLLGTGGMGAVFKAEHRLMERVVALKVILGALVENATSLQRFQQEVKAAAKLAHPNIVTAYDADQAGDLHFLVMEFVEGMSLAQLLDKKGPLPVAHACEYVRQAALGLEHAFEKGMVHRDIKPHNLMLAPKNRVKILDFGLARFVRERPTEGGLTAAGSLMGTPDYIAPEQASDPRQADIRADIYSLGCTLYHLLTGRPPFATGTTIQKILAHMEETPPLLADLRPGLPAELVAVVERMMAKDPAQRYQTPVEAARALVPFVKSGSGVAPAATPSAGRTENIQAPSARNKVTDALAPRKESAAATEAGVESAANKVRSAGPRPSSLRRNPILMAVLAAAVVGLVALFAGAVYRITTDTGELIITTSDPDVEVSIQQSGKLVRILDLKTNQKVELKSGTYELVLPGTKGDLRLSTNNFTLKRGQTVIVEVVHKPTEAVRGPQVPAEPRPTTVPEIGHPPEPGLHPKAGPPVAEVPPPPVKPLPPPVPPAPVHWPAQDLRLGKVHAPSMAKQMLLLDDDFHDPTSGWPQKDSPDPSHHVYRDGKYVVGVKAGPALLNWTNGKPFTDFACQVEGRVTGGAGSWLLSIQPVGSRHVFRIGLATEGNVYVFSTDRGAGDKIPNGVHHTTNRAIMAGAQFNKLLVIVRGRVVEIYVNGVAIVDPVVADEDITPGFLLLGAQSRKQAVEAEFKRITVSSADGLPTPQERGAVRE
jgi:serine/threonine protein kinase